MAVGSYSLTTLANAKAVLGIATADTSQDTLIESYIDRASYEIETRTGRKLKARKYNDGASTHTTTTVADEAKIIFNGHLTRDGGDTLVDPAGYGLYLLPQYPIQANSILTFVLEPLASRTSGVVTWGTALTENVDYLLDRAKGELRLIGCRFVAGIANYRVTMAAGYQFGGAQPYVPPDLEQLCIDIMKRMFRDEYGIQSETIGTWSRSYNSEAMQKKIDDKLMLYTRL